MKRYRNYLSLLLALLLLAGGLGVLALGRRTVEKAHAPQMRRAAETAEAAFAAVREERLRLGCPIDRGDDPNNTGMVGLSYSEITTTLGVLEAKRSTANPNIAALVADLMAEAGLTAGDRVAVNLSGSFPCLNIAVLAAADALELEVIAFSSVGSSTYGANLPRLTWPDMEHLLWEQGILSTRSMGISLGGQADLGLEFPDEVREEIRQRIQAMGYPLLQAEDYDENLAHRLAAYGEVAAFVNAGGNLLSFGPDTTMNTAAGGLLTTLPPGERGSGLVQYYLGAGVPVIHLLNMKDLLPDRGLPYDPIPLPAVGEGAVYRESRHHPAAVGLAILLGLLACGVIGVGFRGGKAGA